MFRDAILSSVRRPCLLMGGCDDDSVLKYDQSLGPRDMSEVKMMVAIPSLKLDRLLIVVEPLLPAFALPLCLGKSLPYWICQIIRGLEWNLDVQVQSAPGERGQMEPHLSVYACCSIPKGAGQEREGYR